MNGVKMFNDEERKYEYASPLHGEKERPGRQLLPRVAFVSNAERLWVVLLAVGVNLSVQRMALNLFCMCPRNLPV